MDQNEIEFTTAEKLKYISQGVATGMLAVYGAYSLARLGWDWAKVGIQTVKDKKNANNEN